MHLPNPINNEFSIPDLHHYMSIANNQIGLPTDTKKKVESTLPLADTAFSWNWGRHNYNFQEITINTIHHWIIIMAG